MIAHTQQLTRRQSFVRLAVGGLFLVLLTWALWRAANR